MEVYFAKDKKRGTTDITETHARVKQMTRTEKGRGHKSHRDNYFSSPDLYNDLKELNLTAVVQSDQTAKECQTT